MNSISLIGKIVTSTDSGLKILNNDEVVFNCDVLTDNTKIRVVAYNLLAKKMFNDLKKNDLIFISGLLKINTKKESKVQYYVHADRVELLNSIAGQSIDRSSKENFTNVENVSQELEKIIKAKDFKLVAYDELISSNITVTEEIKFNLNEIENEEMLENFKTIINEIKLEELANKEDNVVNHLDEFSNMEDYEQLTEMEFFEENNNLEDSYSSSEDNVNNYVDKKRIVKIEKEYLHTKTLEESNKYLILAEQIRKNVSLTTEELEFVKNIEPRINISIEYQEL